MAICSELRDNERPMEVLGVSIFFCTVLFLVDKNKQWTAFWKVVRIGIVASVIVCACGAAAVYIYQRHEAAKIAAAPDFIPANSK